MMKYCKSVTAITFLFLSAALYAQDQKDEQSSADRGKLVFEQNCLACHQADGTGVPQLAPPLVKASFVADKNKVINIVLHGLQGVEIDGEYYSNPMPSFDYLDDQQIADVLTYVRNNFSNNAGPVTPDEVAKARKAEQQK